MAGPPLDVEPSDLFLKLQQMPRPSEVVNFPRRTPEGKPVGKLRIRVLEFDEHDRARKAALEKARKDHKLSDADMQLPLGAALVSDAVARELLSIACVHEKNFGDDEKPFYPLIFPSAEAIGQFLSADEVAVLFNAYLLTQAKWGPFEKTVQTEEELSAWVKRLVEGAAGVPLQHLSLAHSAELASLLAGRVFTLSAILESLFSSLPSTLASRLSKYSIGTGFFGMPASSSPETNTGISLVVADVPITTEDATLMAQRMKDHEAGALAALDAADLERDD